MNRGDIHWIEFPLADGREQAGRRPAIVLQDEAYAGTLPVVLVVPLTTALSAVRFAGTLLIQPTAENHLQPSVTLVFQLRAVDRQRIREPLGSVSPEVLTALLGVVDKLFGRA